MSRTLTGLPLIVVAVLLFAVTAVAPASSPETSGDDIWLVRFHEPGLFQLQAGQTSGRNGQSSAEIAARRSQLIASQASHISTIRERLGRQAEITHYYLASHSGVAIRLGADEADTLRRLPEVQSVQPDLLETLSTYSSPWFIGADTLWSGSAVPDGGPHRGEEMVIAIIDTGIDPTHPAFANDPACEHGADERPDKLISYVDCTATDEAGRCDGWDATDGVGHGTHVAGTAGGNDLSFGDPDHAVSGVAPCAHIRSYKGCQSSGCSWSALQAALDNVLMDGDVDVLNYSISGGLEPWSDLDRTKLDLVAAGILVAASAGNTQPVAGHDDPVGRVNHLGPWVTTVAASTHDAWANALLSAASESGSAPGLDTVRLFRGTGSPNVAAHSELPVRYFDEQPEMYQGCTPGENGAPSDMPVIPSDYFSGAAALLYGTGCSLQVRIENAMEAGAELVLLRVIENEALPPLDTTGQADVPAYGLSIDAGQALVALLGEQDDVTLDIQPVLEDVLADFSFRGPTPDHFDGLTKPDLTAPGVHVYAPDISEDGFGYESGTSMSSPHVAGSAALIRSIHPEWSPAEISSALMMTAHVEGLDDTWIDPWDWDGVGSGRIDLSRAANAGLVMDESVLRYLAGDPTSGDLPLHEINRPSIRDMQCSPGCVLGREVRSVLPGDSHWTASVESLTPGVELDVWPAQFTVNGGPAVGTDLVFADRFDQGSAVSGSQRITVRARPASGGEIGFGRVVLTEQDGRSPPLHITVTVAGDADAPGVNPLHVAPGTIWETAAPDSPTQVRVVFWNQGDSALAWQRSSTVDNGILWAQAVSGSGSILSSHSTTQDDGMYTANDFYFERAQLLTRISTPGTDHGDSLATQPAITWAIFPDQNGRPLGNPQTQPGSALWTYTAEPGDPEVSIEDGNLQLDLEMIEEAQELPAGRYWLTVFPTYDNNVTGSGSRWTWSEAAQSGHGAQLISPTLYNVTNWASITTFGVQFTDTALTLEGRDSSEVQCDAEWISLSPNTGTIQPEQASEVTVSLDASGLSPGKHTAHLCLTSDAPGAGTVIVPVVFTL